MLRRKFLLTELNPRWVSNHSQTCAIWFDCPEGHDNCVHVIPFNPSIDGSQTKWDGQAVWSRQGETFEVLTLSPSILRRRKYKTREEAIAGGCLPEYYTESMICGLHIFIKNGRIEFCSDSV